ncbi:MAG: toprim domain-containing protein, partial [Thermaerobacter sp.]|nr:toprim domain-containing protein [Thermaerobacter sp.]
MSAPIDVLLSRLDKVKKTSDGWQALCPAHDDRNPSLSIKEGTDGTLLVKCWSGCSARDIVAAIGLGLGDLFPDHLRKGRKGLGGQPDPEAEKRIAKAKAERAEKRKQELSERVQDAHNSWNHSPSPLSADSTGLGHDLVRAYFRGRHPLILEAAIAAGVRVLPTTSKSSWNPDTKKRAPCVLWPMRDPRSGDLVGVQREWGRGHENKKMQGRHIVPVDPANPDVTHSAYLRFPGQRDTLYICEGQVTAAAVAAATGQRVVALFDTAGMAKPPRPVIQRAIRDGATRIIVAGDNDTGGIKAALEGIHVIQTWGLKIPIVWTAPPEGQDWADILEREGPDAVGAALVAGERQIPAPEVSAVASATGAVWSIKPWRKAAMPVLPCATVPVAEARIILKDGVQ